MRLARLRNQYASIEVGKFHEMRKQEDVFLIPSCTGELLSTLATDGKMLEAHTSMLKRR